MRRPFSRSGSRWLWYSSCLILGSVVGWVGWVGSLRAGDPIVTEPRRLAGKSYFVGFTHRGEKESSELVVCENERFNEGLVKVYDIEGQEQRRWRVGGGLPDAGLVRLSSAADLYVGTQQGALLFGRLSTPKKFIAVDFDGFNTEVHLSQDGAWLATSGYERVQFWRTADGSECHHPKWSGQHIYELTAFIKQGKESSFVTAGFATRGAIGRWSLPGGEKIRDYLGDENMDRKFVDIATSPDSRWLVGVCCSKKLVVWNIDTGEIVARPDAFSKQGGGCLGQRLAFSGDGKILVCSLREYPTGIKLYRVDGWKELGHFILADRVEWGMGINKIAVDFTGSTVATLDGKGDVQLWNVASALKSGSK